VKPWSFSSMDLRMRASMTLLTGVREDDESAAVRAEPLGPPDS
jgi:hypothetical protein